MNIINDGDLPVGMIIRQKVASQIAEKAFDGIWNMATQVLSDMDKQITGNEALSYFGKILAEFAARWLIEMDKIAKTDDAGVDTEELIKNTINHILSTLEIEATFEDEKKELPHGIKRLK